ncbi:hypothetical protein [Tellurirhabdus rosea]|uniref:hypothetical protein n=1 Tax=Tellurirhabdus rosea TaxID=2674997 RepID=UPI00225188C8|nr:hypothetical protein [Tellurirhabdus rosea]
MTLPFNWNLIVGFFPLLLLLTAGCQTVRNGSYKTRSYVWVGKHLNRPWPHVIDLRKGEKRLVFVGCDHVRDTTHRQFSMIEQYFRQVKPQIAFNEGGPLTRQYQSLHEAISRDGETGCLKFLSDKAGIHMLDGDLNDSLEYALMLRRYPKEQLFLYYIMERTVIPHLSGFNGNEPFEKVYPKEIETYYVRRGFPLAEHERGLAYFENLYQKYIGRPFLPILNADVEKFDYVNGGNCLFCALGRATKMLRDSVLLAKIDRALDQHDRVMVTFGGGHALALEPALKQLMRRKRAPGPVALRTKAAHATR